MAFHPPNPEQEWKTSFDHTRWQIPGRSYSTTRTSYLGDTADIDSRRRVTLNVRLEGKLVPRKFYSGGI
jgi:hypothetical protein